VPPRAEQAPQETELERTDSDAVVVSDYQKLRRVAV
jgi:hypothetical protein